MSDNKHPHEIASAKFHDVVVALRDYADNPGYSHNDYADTMRQAAHCIESLRAMIFNYSSVVRQATPEAPTPEPVAVKDALRRCGADTDYHGKMLFTVAQFDHFVSMIRPAPATQQAGAPTNSSSNFSSTSTAATTASTLKCEYPRCACNSKAVCEKATTASASDCRKLGGICGCQFGQCANGLDRPAAAYSQEAQAAHAGASPVWRPIAEAPRDGTRFWYLQPITVVSVTAPARIQYNVMEVWRARTSPETSGYWTNYATSIPDHAMLAGWFLLCNGGEVDAARRCCAQREDKPSSNSIASNAAEQGEKK